MEVGRVFIFLLAFLIFRVCVYSEGNTIEWPQTTFNLALLGRQASQHPRNRISLWPPVQSYSISSSSLCWEPRPRVPE